jgi:hypothetical protein
MRLILKEDDNVSKDINLKNKKSPYWNLAQFAAINSAPRT